jgi:N6-adenosine-specific RNA methylase IME4
MRYRTIVADPPWKTTAGPLTGAEHFEGPKGPSRPLPYRTMTVEQICALPVRDLAADDAALYLWTTNGYLPRAFDVVRAWGFKYSTTIVWTKNPMGSGLGGAWGLSTEFVIYARLGSPAEKCRIPSTWWGWKRPYDKRGKPRHSAKAPHMQDLVEQMHDGPYLEMFARSQRLGWDTWGDEALEHVALVQALTPSLPS